MHGPDLNKIGGDKTPCLYVLRFVKNKIAHRDIYAMLLYPQSCVNTSNFLCSIFSPKFVQIYFSTLWREFLSFYTTIILSILHHYNDVIMSAMGSQITSLAILYSTVYLRCKSKKTSKLRVIGLCPGNSPVISPHKRPVTRKMLPFDDVIMLINVYGYRRQSVIWAGQIITHVYFIRQLPMCIFGNLLYWIGAYLFVSSDFNFNMSDMLNT